MKTYIIQRTNGGVSVSIMDADDEGIRPLLPRFDLFNHSPTGFEYGYGGSGPSQLALAILADFLGDDEAALLVYQNFKFDVIANLDRSKDHVITQADIARWLEKQESGR